MEPPPGQDEAVLDLHYSVETPIENMSPWVLRLLFDNAQLDSKEIVLSEVSS